MIFSDTRAQVKYLGNLFRRKSSVCFKKMLEDAHGLLRQTSLWLETVSLLFKLIILPLQTRYLLFRVRQRRIRLVKLTDSIIALRLQKTNMLPQDIGLLGVRNKGEN